MAELAVKYFIKNGVSKLLVTNRTFAHAMKLAEENWGSAIRFEQLSDYLENADIVIGSTGAQDFIITESMVKRCIKRRKGIPMFFIDIAVPRDIDPRLNNLANVYAYDIDDLQNVVDDNRKEREQQALVAEQIIAEEVEKLHSWSKTFPWCLLSGHYVNSFTKSVMLNWKKPCKRWAVFLQNNKSRWSK